MDKTVRKTPLLLYRYEDLVAFGIIRNRMTLYRWIKKGTFPRPVKIGANTVAWRAESVERWFADKEAASAA
jgi:prophage regulatory protein